MSSRGATLLAFALPSAFAQLTFGGGGTVVRTETIYSPVRQRGAQSNNPFAGVVPGVALLAGSAALLWWNEGRTARTERLLADARTALMPLDATSRAALEGAEEGGLVHLTGHLSTGGVRDGLFDEVRRPDALRLRRTTENYQWEETKHVSERRISASHVQRETRYDYHTRWSPRQVASSGFKDEYHHRNPHARLPAGVVESIASDATLPNGLRVPTALIEQLDVWDGVQLPKLRRRDGAVVTKLAERNAESIYFAAPGTEERLEGLPPPGGAPGGRLPPPLPPLPASVPHTISSGHGESQVSARRYLENEHARLDRLDGKQMAGSPLPPTPVVGDARVTFTEVRVPEEGVSILAAVQPSGTWGASRPVLKPWTSDAATREREGDGSVSGDGSVGGLSGVLHSMDAPSLFMLVRGKVGPREMLRLARSKADQLKWGLRALGAGLMWAGFACTLSFLPAIAAYMPIIGGVASTIAGVATSVAALGGALAGSMLVIAAAWARFRPLHAAGLAAAAAAGAVGQAWLFRRLAAGKALGGMPAGMGRRAGSA